MLFSQNEGKTFVLINQMPVFLLCGFPCKQGDVVFELAMGE